MINGAQFASNVAAGIAVEKTSDFLNTDDHLLMLKSIDGYLREIADSLSRQASPDEVAGVSLQPYPYLYQVKSYDRNHFCMFVPGTAAVSLSFNVQGVGMYTKSVGPGWIQVDLPGGTEVYSGDTSNHNVLIVFCDDARGIAI